MHLQKLYLVPLGWLRYFLVRKVGAKYSVLHVVILTVEKYQGVKNFILVAR